MKPDAPAPVLPCVPPCAGAPYLTTRTHTAGNQTVHRLSGTSSSPLYPPRVHIAVTQETEGEGEFAPARCWQMWRRWSGVGVVTSLPLEGKARPGLVCPGPRQPLGKVPADLLQPRAAAGTLESGQSALTFTLAPSPKLPWEPEAPHSPGHTAPRPLPHAEEVPGLLRPSCAWPSCRQPVFMSQLLPRISACCCVLSEHCPKCFPNTELFIPVIAP